MHRFILLLATLVFFVAVADAYAVSIDEVPVALQQDIVLPDSRIIQIEYEFNPDTTKRYIVFGGWQAGAPPPPSLLPYGTGYDAGFLSVSVLSEEEALFLAGQGYHVIEDFKLDFHSGDVLHDGSRTAQIAGLDRPEYDAAGAGATVAIIDTGVDFSNPDIRHSLARDGIGHPVMLDPDGQGIVITNSTFFGNIDDNGIIRNYDRELPENVTSSVYVNDDGVFLDLLQGGKGTTIQVYNSFYPDIGPSPVLDGTIINDMKIGDGNRDYIRSMSGMYHLGAMYQGYLSGSLAGVQVVPVLVVDSVVPGVYDTVIPDLSTSWSDYTRNSLELGQTPEYDFDFTDEKPIVLGSGNEFLVYDSDEDGTDDYSAGTVGARVLDIYDVMDMNMTDIDDVLGAVNGTLLPALDPDGMFFGVMTDFAGHGTASASVIASSGQMSYDLYNDTQKYSLPGVAPDASILPVKALWFGDVVYGWLWAAGFEEDDGTWKFSGAPRADILSNSWGISAFPRIGVFPGYDSLSLLLGMLATPHSLDDDYPGVLMVTSAGNAGHGYGTMGPSASSPMAVTVGATNNNVIVGYNSLKDQPRFGNTTEHLNHIIDFSSRGPGAMGFPKPDTVSVGAYGFVPKTVTKVDLESTADPFSTYGGTSMAAPMVAGIAAVVMGEMTAQSQDYDPPLIKSILMSTATDLGNDPFVQGSGLADAGTALDYVHGNRGVFVVDNTASYDNIRNVLDPAMAQFNTTAAHIEEFGFPTLPATMTSWFAGHLLPGDRTTASFTIRNPGDEELSVRVIPQEMSLIESGFYKGDTAVRKLDPVLEAADGYAPNYIRLADIQNQTSTADFFDRGDPIPEEASLMVLNVHFPFGEFMNKTADIYADDLRISSLYVYDWVDADADSKVASSELSLVNRGGSWGTVQELRVSDPTEKFEGVPLVGVYPVPEKYSYWVGAINQNATSMEYTVSARYYERDDWSMVWPGQDTVNVPPGGSASVDVTLVVPDGTETGVYQGFVQFEGDTHVVNAPVSFAVRSPVSEDDPSLLIMGVKGGDPMYGNGYTKGAFDMTGRYMAGDWRQYYFDVQDESINSAAIKISWVSEDTSIAAFVANPAGQIIHTNVPSGVFGHFLNWPSIDWLGTSPFSGGGGFFPVDNNNNNKRSTVLHVPINQTGTYTLLTHSTLFGGDAVTEPITLAALFTSIFENEIPEDTAEDTAEDTPTDTPDNTEDRSGSEDDTDETIGDETAARQDDDGGMRESDDSDTISKDITGEPGMPELESGLLTIEPEVVTEPDVVERPDGAVEPDTSGIGDKSGDGASEGDVVTSGSDAGSESEFDWNSSEPYLIGIAIGAGITVAVVVGVILALKQRKVRWLPTGKPV